MSTSQVLLGLLADGPKHGYELKRAHDTHMPRAKPLAFGQVYATLGRLQRDGLVAEGGRAQDAGPERTTFTLTDQGRERLDAWLSEVEPPAPFVSSALLAKVVVALLAADGRRANTYLTAQRAAHQARLRELTAAKLAPDSHLGDIIAADFAISHLDADLRWMDTTIARVADPDRGVRS